MSLGSGEIFVIVILALLLFGPDKLPDLARQAARVIRDVRRAADEVKSQFNILDDNDDEPRRPLTTMRDKINERDNERDETQAGSIASTRNQTDNAEALQYDETTQYGEDVNPNDSYFINDENGNAPDDNNWNDNNRDDARNDWRNCEEDRAGDSSDLQASNRNEDNMPMTAQEVQLFDTTPAKSVRATSDIATSDIETFDDASEPPRDAASELELRTTPTTSVARTSPPNRVRADADETSD